MSTIESLEKTPPTVEEHTGENSKRSYEEIHSPTKKTRTPKKKKGNVTTMEIGRMPLGTPVFDPDTPTRPRKDTPFPTKELTGLGAEATASRATTSIPPFVLPTIDNTWAIPAVPAAIERGETSEDGSLAQGMEGVTITQAADTVLPNSAPAQATIPPTQPTFAQIVATNAPATAGGPGQPFVPIQINNDLDVHIQRFTYQTTMGEEVAKIYLNEEINRAIVTVSNDRSGADAVARRRAQKGVIATVEHLGDTDDMLVVPMASEINATNPLGFTIGNKPAHALVTGLTNEQERALTAHRAYTNGAQVVFAHAVPLTPSSFAMMLTGLKEIEPSKQNTKFITEACKKVIGSHPDVRARMTEFHDRTDRFTDSQGDFDADRTIKAFTNSLRVVGRSNGVDDKTEWSLRWECPTYSSQGEYLWVTTLRHIVISTIFGPINRKEAPIVWCNVCHHNDHTHPYCPFPKLAGWPNVNANTNTGGAGGHPGGAPGGGPGGYGARGARGGTRGNRGGRGGRGRGTA